MEEELFEMNELIDFINEQTGIEKDVIEKVFEAEVVFMREKGVLEE